MKKIIYASCSMLLALSLSSCLKDKNQNSDFLDAKADKFIEILEATHDPRASQPISSVTALELLPTIETYDVFSVRVGGQTAVNAESVNYSITVNNAILPSGILPLPAGSYTIVNPTGSIAAGSDEVKIKLRLDKTTLGFTNVYGIGVVISSNNAKVNDNAKSIVLEYLVKNKYDGIYGIKGYTLRAGDAPKTGNFCCQEMGLATIGADDVEWDRPAYWADLTGIGLGVAIRTGVNPSTNAATMYNSFPIYNAPGYNTRYEPATKTFYVSFSWGAGPAARLSTDTLTYLRPRP